MKKLINRLIITLLTLYIFPVLLTASEKIRERVYIQTDKSVYLAGEQLWLKMYVTNLDNTPSVLSKIGYVELVDETETVISIKLDLKYGIGNGWMELPVHLPTGYYRLIGYTRYMHNEGAETYFDYPLTIINTFMINPDVEIINDTIPIHNNIQHLPGVEVELQLDKPYLSVCSKGIVSLSNLPENVHTLGLSIAACDIFPEYTLPDIQTWKEQISQSSLPLFSDKWIAEYEGHIVTGNLTSMDTDRIPGKDENIASMIGFTGKHIRIAAGQIREDSKVNFYIKEIQGANELATVAVSSWGNKYRIDIESPFVTHTLKEQPVFSLHSSWENPLLQRSIHLQAQHIFNEDSLNRFYSVEPFFPWQPDWSYKLDEYTRFPTMQEVIVEFVMGLRFRRINNKRILSVLKEDATGYASGTSLVLLDGIPIMDHEVIFNYNPLLINKIDIYRGKYWIGGQQFEGIVSFWSYQNNCPDLKVDNTIQFFDYEGTQPTREFYHPIYEGVKSNISPIPDYRHTLLWQPDIEVKGKTDIQIPFYTSEITGTFKVTVEGLTADGKIISGTTTFKVE